MLALLYCTDFQRKERDEYMIKTLTNVLRQDKEKFAVPRKVQDIIPIWMQPTM